MITRRLFLGTAAGLAGSATVAPAQSPVPAPLPPGVADRIEGLLVGTLIGDALGGPIEFQPPDKVAGLPLPPRRWHPGQRLDAGESRLARERLISQWRGYGELRPVPEPYAHWRHQAPPGTITDDSRHKLVLLEALAAIEQGRTISVEDLARAYLEWPRSSPRDLVPGWERLRQDWLGEWWYAARWVLGERDLSRARPPERMWNGLATCCGQMTSLPLACVFAGAPNEAYEAAFRLGFFDNGFGRDLNAALVGGLAAAVGSGHEGLGGWSAFAAQLRRADPYGHADIPWCRRSVDRWLGVAQRCVEGARGEPALLFDALETEFRDTVKWEAQVPFVVVAACWEMAGGDPLVALSLTLEWGHDTDSYAQVAGALAGALHGPGIFPDAWREAVASRLKVDYGVHLDAEVKRLIRLAGLARIRPVVSGVRVVA